MLYNLNVVRNEIIRSYFEIQKENQNATRKMLNANELT